MMQRTIAGNGWDNNTCTSEIITEMLERKNYQEKCQ